MKRLLGLSIAILFFGNSYSQSTIYYFKVDSVAGSQHIDFANYQNKKMVIVNIATGDSLVSQLAELEQFYQLYKDSVVVIAISSNSFNNEPMSNSEIAAYCSNTYHLHFPVSAKIDVSGNGTDSLYKWLTRKSMNSVISATMHGAFQKFLVNRQGKVVGIFARKMSPMNEVFRHAIEVL